MRKPTSTEEVGAPRYFASRSKPLDVWEYQWNNAAGEKRIFFSIAVG
jgi:hypothetical protein